MNTMIIFKELLTSCKIQLPLVYDDGAIYDSDKNHLFNIRSWGRLTGRLNFSPIEAVKIQDTIGNYIVSLVNYELMGIENTCSVEEYKDALGKAKLELPVSYDLGLDIIGKCNGQFLTSEIFYYLDDNGFSDNLSFSHDKIMEGFVELINK